MQDMIVRPAQCAGLKVSENLARRIVNDTGSESADLPLLAFVLDQLFDKRTDYELSDEVYNDLGGVKGAIAEHVKAVEQKIKKLFGGKTADLSRIFQALTVVQKEEALPTRRRPLLSAFDPEQRKVVDLLIRKRLLRTEGEGESATVSISHENSSKPGLRCATTSRQIRSN